MFLCYRRLDSAPWAGRIYDALGNRLGHDRVLMDLAFTPLDDFDAQVEAAVRSTQLLLVIIGSTWLAAFDDVLRGGRRRRDDPHDPVRTEIRAALGAGVPIHLVLIEDATIPASSSLPPDIAALATMPSTRLRHATWNDDLDRLLSVVSG